jgi:hypothetical protein
MGIRPVMYWTYKAHYIGRVDCACDAAMESLYCAEEIGMIRNDHPSLLDAMREGTL